ncbi:aminotransferase class IV [Pontibacter sp. HJ8]
MLLYNNTFLPEPELKLPLSNRAFQYNDGFFETILVVNGKLRFWADHQERMREAATALQLVIPDSFWKDELEEKLLLLAKQQAASDYGRLKLKVWRTGGGLYTPQTNEIEWLATVEPTQAIPETGIKIAVCQTARTSLSPLSHFKGPHAPLYVLAGIEKQTKGFNDMLLLNAEGFVAELISSNIFWIRENVLYTPTLETGCVNGIMRRNILRYCSSAGIAVMEVYVEIGKVKEADAAFAANVTGLRVIGALEDKAFASSHPLLRQLQDALL